MTQVTERPITSEYAAPVLQPLGTLRSLTRGAGPGGEPVVMQTGIPGALTATAGTFLASGVTGP